MLGSPLLYLKGMRAIMFQLSGFYYKPRNQPSVLALPRLIRETRCLDRMGGSVWGFEHRRCSLGFRGLGV